MILLKRNVFLVSVIFSCYSSLCDALTSQAASSSSSTCPPVVAPPPLQPKTYCRLQNSVTEGNRFRVTYSVGMTNPGEHINAINSVYLYPDTGANVDLVSAVGQVNIVPSEKGFGLKVFDNQVIRTQELKSSISFVVTGTYSGIFKSPTCVTTTNGGTFPPQFIPKIISNTAPMSGTSIEVNFINPVDSDGDIIHYAIDFGDGKKILERTKAYHAYASPGRYRVTMTASDQYAQTVHSRWVDVKPATANNSPIAAFVYDLQSFSLKADARGSYSADGKPLSFNWSVLPSVTSSTANAMTFYTQLQWAGKNYLTLDVSDQNTADTTQAELYPRCGVTIDFISQPFMDYQRDGMSLKVDARKSANFSGVLWDFGDGTTSTLLSNTHTYQQPGTYDVKLRANGLFFSGSTSRKISITPSNTAPSASLVCTESAKREVNKNVFVANCVITGTDAENDQLSYTIDWGDGSEPTNHLKDTIYGKASASHKYISGGSYSIRLVASDGQQETTSTSVYTATAPNVTNDLAPIAALSCTEILVQGKYMTRCDATGSTDPESDVLTFTWQMGDGGEYVTTSGPTPSYIEHEYALAGSYEVKLIVSDGTHQVSTTTLVNARDNLGDGDFVPCFTVTPQQTNSGVYVFSASCTQVPVGQTTDYAWEFGDGTTAYGMNVTKTYVASGRYRVILRFQNGYIKLEKEIDVVITRPVASCVYSVVSQWDTGFVGSVKITNLTDQPLRNWSVNWQYINGGRVTNSWNSILSGANPYNATPYSWNSVIQPSTSIEFGFQGSKPSGAAEVPKVTGVICP